MRKAALLMLLAKADGDIGSIGIVDIGFELLVFHALYQIIHLR